MRWDEDFDAIVERCRDGRSGSLTPEAVEVYRRVHELGFIATVGTYRDGRLVGGLWGLSVGSSFGVLSMFHLEDHAGSLAVAAAVQVLRDGRRWELIDCGEINEHFRRYGAYEVPTRRFCELVWHGLIDSDRSRSDDRDATPPA